MIRLHYVLYTALLSFICAGCHTPKTASPIIGEKGYFPPENPTFIVAADPQLFRGEKDDFDKAILTINDLEPDFVVMCGDLIETPGNLKQIEAYQDSVSKLSPNAVLYNVSGNHDLGRPADAENILNYQKHFGKLWYDFEYGDCLFIVLSSDILQNDNLPEYQQQRQWLTELLEQSPCKKQTFVFMHHPLYLNSPDEPDAYSNMPIQIRRELLHLFAKHKVQAVFSGHYHNNHVNCFKGVDLITTNSITVPMGNAPAAGFRIVEVNQDRYDQQYFTLEQLEKKEVTK